MTTLRLLAVVCMLVLPAISQVNPRGKPPSPSTQNNQVSEFSFRGISPGMSEQGARNIVAAKFPAYAYGNPQCGKYTGLECKDPAQGVRDCTVSSFCGGDEETADTQALNLVFVDNKLSTINFVFPHDPTTPLDYRGVSVSGFDNYADIRNAVLEKYGKPAKSTKADVQTKGGAHYTCDVLQWENASASMRLEEICVDLDRSCLVITDNKLAQESQKRVQAAHKPEI